MFGCRRFCGGIIPVLKTEDMTQPVGVAADGRLYTAPTGGADVETEIEALDGRVTTLENQQAAGGGNVYVCVPYEYTTGDNAIYLNYKTLPAGAVIDKYELVINQAGLTHPTKFEIIPHTTGGGTSVIANGGYSGWSITHSVNGNDTITTLSLGINTLYTTALVANDIITYARIYYHV